MDLLQYLKPGLIILGETPPSKEDAIQRLIGRILAEHPGIDGDVLMQKIRERESLSPTTYPNGIAIPHARIEGLNDLIVSILIPKSPVRENDIDIRAVFLILTDSAKSNLYLNVLASIVKICDEEKNIARMSASASPDDFIRTLSGFATPIKQAINAKDIMSILPLHLFPHSTVKDALDFMSRHDTGYIPICDANRKLLGEVNIYDILTIGLPPYAQMLKNLRFLSRLEPLEDLLKNEEKVPISSIMRKPSVVISPEAYIIEVVFQFIKNNHRTYFPVVDHGVYVGVISYMDIVNKFLRV